MSYKIFALNPGSTSTKIAMFEDDKPVFITKAVHTAEELAKYPKIADQLPYRRQTILDAVAAQGATLEGVDCFVARCGGLQPCEGGVYAVTDKVVADCFSGYTVHPAILGGKLAQSFAEEFGGTALLLNPPDTDEFQDVARVTGLHDVYRTSNVHMLNQKETAIRAAAELGKKYEDCNFVVAHIGGGVSVTAHRKGKAVDSNSIIMGEGPMTPTRAGALPAIPFMDLCYSGKYTKAEMLKKLRGEGGMSALLGTHDCREIERRIQAGDERAALVYKAQALQIAKGVGTLLGCFTELIDAVILTGGLAYSKMLTDMVIGYLHNLARVVVIPGENEMEALALGGLRVLRGQETAKIFHKSESANG